MECLDVEKNIYILHNHRFNRDLELDDEERVVNQNLVLTSTQEGVEDMQERVKEVSNGHHDIKSYRTADSYLLNVDQCYARVLVDEGMMLNTGKIEMIAAMSQCDELVVIGANIFN